MLGVMRYMIHPDCRFRVVPAGVKLRPDGPRRVAAEGPAYAGARYRRPLVTDFQAAAPRTAVFSRQVNSPGCQPMTSAAFSSGRPRR